jgi:hypothetical protein
MGALTRVHPGMPTSRNGRLVRHPEFLFMADLFGLGTSRCCSKWAFFSLSVGAAQALVEKMASNKSWNDECTPTHTGKVHQLEQVDMLTAKIDLPMKKT